MNFVENLQFGPLSANDQTLELPSFLDCLPYAPYNKNDKLGRVADWTAPPESKDSNAAALAASNMSSSLRRKREAELQAQQTAIPTLFTYQHEETEDSSFSVVDRQAATLRKNAVRSVKPLATRTAAGTRAAPTTSAKPVAKKPTRWERVVRIRDPSIKINPNWKVVEELDFSRMSNLYYEVDDPEDMY
ncbi:hypothetical protein HDU91_003043, partial [Kappamyces sp. JEL0680]